MALETQIIEGKEAVVVPMTADLELASEEDAEIYKIVFLDGSEIRFVIKVPEGAEPGATSTGTEPELTPEARRRRARAALAQLKQS